MSDLIDRVRRANPVPDESRPFPDAEEFRRLVVERTGMLDTAQLEQSLRQPKPRKGWLIAAVGFAVVVVLAGIGVLFNAVTQPDTDVAGPLPPTPEEQALQTGERFFAALTAGNAEAALALMQPQVLDSPMIGPAIEFVAALPGSKTFGDCTVTTDASGVTLRCTITFDGPLFQATEQTARFGQVMVGKDGLLSSRPVFGDRSGVDRAFVEYATEVEPEAFDQVCSPDAYEFGSVNTLPGYAWTGPCGELWAQLADDAAAWVDAGKPDLSQ